MSLAGTNDGREDATSGGAGKFYLERISYDIGFRDIVFTPIIMVDFENIKFGNVHFGNVKFRNVTG